MEKLESHHDNPLQQTPPAPPGENQPESDSLRVQLSELNNRSRWYSTQRWVIPLAYVGGTANVLFQLDTPNKTIIGCAYIAASLIGIPLLNHLSAIDKAVGRAVRNIQETERALHLPETAKYKAESITEPLELLTLLTAVVYSIIGVGTLFP
jgi:hypothetical protein